MFQIAHRGSLAVYVCGVGAPGGGYRHPEHDTWQERDTWRGLATWLQAPCVHHTTSPACKHSAFICWHCANMLHAVKAMYLKRLYNDIESFFMCMGNTLRSLFAN